jgi:hypothetical protein
MVDAQRWLGSSIDEDVHAFARNDEPDVIPLVLLKRRCGLVLGIDVPKYATVDDRDILQTVLGYSAVRANPEIEHVGVVGVLLTKADARHVFADGLDIELDGAAIKLLIFQCDKSLLAR